MPEMRWTLEMRMVADSMRAMNLNARLAQKQYLRNAVAQKAPAKRNAIQRTKNAIEHAKRLRRRSLGKNI